jgi:metal-responsive CopG/Arc/MetJ family transcriptional regulator
MKKQLSITIDSELIEEIDKKRGMIKRSTFIEELIRRALKKW